MELPKIYVPDLTKYDSRVQPGIFNNNLVVTPELNYQLMPCPLSVVTSAPRLGGENQIALAVKFGYRF